MQAGVTCNTYEPFWAMYGQAYCSGSYCFIDFWSAEWYNRGKKKVLPVNGCPLLRCSIAAQFSRQGRLFLFIQVFAKRIAEAKAGNAKSQ